MRPFRTPYNACDVIFYLHSHTDASDGPLDPDALFVRADECGVDVLAITDHDTLAAIDQIDTALARTRLIPGIEFSTAWRNYGHRWSRPGGVPPLPENLQPA